MKYLLFLSSLVLGESQVFLKAPNPCDHYLIILAEKKGLKAIPISDLLMFEKLVEECERNGGRSRIRQMYTNDWKRDYERAKTMASWTSTHAVCVFVTFGYYFLGKIFATKPGN